ncbi:S-type pyocin domain-containing protein [Salmonella enterica]|nr:pyocin [Salmonella enterica subsp. diarizonae]EGV3636095.1 pyocin [Salmonella enterica]EKL0444601.1 S-type pyocin domain-containing protein [Salmonella enterica]HCM1889872.1 S-type pyocin domain-containing protein [Salmonella enterica subsp. diarizonae serovar 57:c:z]
MSRQLAKLGDKTTSGGQIVSATSDCSDNGVSLVVTGDMALCPKCKGAFQIMGTDVHWSSMGKSHVATGDRVLCHCPNNQVIGNTTYSVEDLPKNPPVTQVRQSSAPPTPPVQQVPVKQPPSPVFAKSSLRGTGCTDAGEQQEPHTNFAEMGIFQARPPAATDDEVPQHTQTAKKKPTAPEDIQKPKKRSALYRWLNGNHEEIQNQAAVTVAATATRAQTATAGASVLEQIAGRFATYGTWAVRGAVTTSEVAAGGLGAPVAGLLVGMMPGRLNDGEQDFIDRMRAEQMREAPTRVRFTWENNTQGKPVPHGWHTPPGKDMVRVRKMEWDARQQAYTFTTEEANPVTIIWTPDSSGVNTPSNTGNQATPVMPNPVIVDPLPDNTRITATTSPAPEEKNFADYILILPVSDIPPIYIYIRNNPGQVTGKGQKISGIWLADAGTGNGSPVPNQIADRLRGREFANFDQFREAFWREVANDPELSKQFIPANVSRLRNGRAPRAKFSDTVGKRRSFEIHHIVPISQGGDVYNVDNMGITTPKRHIDLHRGN